MQQDPGKRKSKSRHGYHGAWGGKNVGNLAKDSQSTTLTKNAKHCHPNTTPKYRTYSSLQAAKPCKAS